MNHPDLQVVLALKPHAAADDVSAERLQRIVRHMNALPIDAFTMMIMLY